MAVEKRYHQRRFRLEESTTQNDGARTIFTEITTPGTTQSPNFKRNFSQDLQLVSGSLTVFMSEQPLSAAPDLNALESSGRKLEIGETVTFPPNVYVKYLVGEESMKLRAIVTPGHHGFEQLLMIMNGLAADGELAKYSDSTLLMAVIMDLTETDLIGPTKDLLDSVREKQSKEIADLKGSLLETYGNEASPKALLAGDAS